MPAEGWVVEAIWGNAVGWKSLSSFADDDKCLEQVNIVFESVLGLNVDKIVDLSLAVAEDISTETNHFLGLDFFAL